MTRTSQLPLLLPDESARRLDWEARDIVSASLALGCASAGGPLSPDECRLVKGVAGANERVGALRDAVLAGLDPLGEAIQRLRSPAARRRLGAVYTPLPVVRSMVDWVMARRPSRVVDPGCGSGRFAAEAVRRDPSVEVVAVDNDPLATLACRAVLATLGANHARVVNADYPSLKLEPAPGPTAFVGNPPYVRHHLLSPAQKAWAKRAAAALGLRLSGLAGLHVYFFIATAALAREGDYGCFITSAEWLDVGYGKVLRSQLADGLGAVAIHLLDPEAVTFDDVMTTAVITCFEVATASPSIRVRTVESVQDLGDLDSGGRCVSRAELRRSVRWTPLFRESAPVRAEPRVRLGDLVRVSRGAVTGRNEYFVLERQRAQELCLLPYALPVLSRAQEVLSSDGIVRLDETRRLLLDPPRGIDRNADEHRALHEYLTLGERLGVPQGYICGHRYPWWHVGAKAPPIVATYMARQPPAFALNPDGMAILNVLHGLFPRYPLDEEQMLGLVRYMNAHRVEFQGAGRTYQGGLEKFEPTEMEALPVPPPERLREYARS